MSNAFENVDQPIESEDLDELYLERLAERVRQEKIRNLEDRIEKRMESIKLFRENGLHGTADHMENSEYMRGLLERLRYLQEG